MDALDKNLKRKTSAKKPKARTKKAPVVVDLNTLIPKDAGRSYIKHRIECKCILPQFKNVDPPLFHKFVVFSVIDMDGTCMPSYAQCNNCGHVHRVMEIGKSQLTKKENMSSIKTVEDIKLSLPAKLVGLMEQANCDYPTWQEAEFIVENKLWGKAIILTKETEGSTVAGKYVIVLGDNLYKVESFEKETETESVISG